MADHAPTGPVEVGGEMDYPEHEKTYNVFLHVVKYGSLICIAILIAMVAHFFWGFGFFSSLILFALLNAVGAYLLR
ncbi:MAG: aa3-type cytochrome c oxidase subunit IV [Mesorhizobium sp.]